MPLKKKETPRTGRALQENPTLGTSVGNEVFKIRLAVASKNKGKSGGMRIMYLARVTAQNIYLFSIFDKSEKESISAKDITQILKTENLL